MRRSPLRVLVVLGTRPEAIKLAPVIARLRSEPTIETIICVTAQHRAILDDALNAFAIVPDIDLDLMRPGQLLPEQLSAAITAIAGVVQRERPHLVVVQGDTTSAVAAAQAGFLMGVAVAHVEAGLRSHRLDDPFPEEGHRRTITSITTLHFAPTPRARDNLLREGVPPHLIALTGNTVVDALQEVLQSDAFTSVVAPVPEEGQQQVLVTLHRRENWGKRIAGICRGLSAALDDVPNARIVIPMHPNPDVRAAIMSVLGARSRVSLIEPLSYAAFVKAMRSSTLIVTDSGGVQEEAPTLGVPVLVVRETTERPEAVEAGAAWLIGVDPRAVHETTRDLLTHRGARGRVSAAVNPFGDGRAAARIVERILVWAGAVRQP